MCNSFRSLLSFLILCKVLFASTVTVSLSPQATAVSPGQMLSTEAGVAGLGNPPSVGSFDLTVAYNASLLSFKGVTFGLMLGDPGLSEALTVFDASPGSVEFAEVSLLSDTSLDALQSSSFALATLSFQGLETGVASFSFSTGVVDDAFGNKLVEVREPEIASLIGLILMGWGFTRRRRIAGAYMLALLAFLLAADAARAQKTTQKTKPNQIGATDRSAAPPRPVAPNVCVQHTVTVDSKTGDASLTAQFTNKDANPKKFVFCQMIGVSDAQMVTAAECDIFKDGNTIRCKRSSRSFSSALDTFHFGCKLVSLGANGSMKVDYGSGQSDKFKGKKASDFKVTYADYVQLDAGVGFDEASCTANMCFGKDANTGLLGTLAIMGDWYLPKLPFDDPYLSYQPVCRVPQTPEYSSLSSSLATPSNFPAHVPQLPPNTPGSVPSSYPVPLNLFDVYTMAPDSPPVQAAITTLVSPSFFQANFTTNPPAAPSTFVIQGGAEAFGSLTTQRPTSANEGDSADVNVVFHLPDSQNLPGPALFEEKGFFIKDTAPPSVSRHLLLFDPSNLLHVEVTATDAITTPLAAEFWYSTDGGLTWSDSPLTSTTDLFDDQQHTRVFSGDVGTFAPLAQLQYFVTVQDEVFNVNFLGVGQATATLSCDINGDGKVDITDINLILAARGTNVSPGDPRDVDRDCQITVNDARACVLRCSKPNCAQ